MASYAGALLTGFYAAIDRRDWSAVLAAVTPDVDVHLHSWTRPGPVDLAGRDEVGAWLAGALTDVEAIDRTLTAVYDEGTAAAVFLTATTTGASTTATTSRLDSFRFADGRIAAYVSLQVG